MRTKVAIDNAPEVKLGHPFGLYLLPEVSLSPETCRLSHTLPFNLLAFGSQVKLARCLIIDRFLVINYNIRAL